MVNGGLSMARPARKIPEVARARDRSGIHARWLAEIADNELPPEPTPGRAAKLPGVAVTQTFCRSRNPIVKTAMERRHWSDPLIERQRRCPSTP